MILPGYENPKTICVVCWKKIIDSQEESWNRLNEMGDEGMVHLAKDFTILSNKAAAFLARGGFFYTWEMIRQHVVNGYHVYQKVCSTPFPHP